MPESYHGTLQSASSKNHSLQTMKLVWRRGYLIDPVTESVISQWQKRHPISVLPFVGIITSFADGWSNSSNRPSMQYDLRNFV